MISLEKCKKNLMILVIITQVLIILIHSLNKVKNRLSLKINITNFEKTKLLKLNQLIFENLNKLVIYSNKIISFINYFIHMSLADLMLT